jgi:peptidoglycan/LPS O-acetylase OafA/YrhL
LVVLLVDAPRATGSGDNPAVWVFGLPGFLAIAGTVIGWVAAGLPSVEVVDAPVRQRRFRRAGRAAATERGQLPGSEVPPRYATTPRDRRPSS